ncbi:MAG TPA: hypothetical protein VFD50_05470 [Thermoleophilia bacterium]|nr:hypothetical protein [Thermoleophilia bacterium]
MSIGPIEILIILVLELVPVVLTGWLVARKGYEPVWLWVVLALLFNWVILIVALVLPQRRAA